LIAGASNLAMKIAGPLLLLLLIGCAAASKPTDLGYADYGSLKIEAPITRPKFSRSFFIEPVRIAPSAEQGANRFCDTANNYSTCEQLIRRKFVGNDIHQELIGQEAVLGSILQEQGLTVTTVPDANSIIVRPILTEVVMSSETSRQNGKNVGIIGGFVGFESSTKASFLRLDVLLVDPKTDSYLDAYHSAGTFSENSIESGALFFKVRKEERSLALDSLRLAFIDITYKLLRGIDQRGFQ